MTSWGDGLAAAIEPGGHLVGDTLERVLHAVRTHLRMDIAYVSEFKEDRTVFRAIDADVATPVQAGDSLPLDSVYCGHILAGRLPALIADTSEEPLAQQLDVTAQVPIGAHLSVPITLADGRVYGMFCCLNTSAMPGLNDRDLDIMRTFADVTAIQIGRDMEATDLRDRARERVNRLFDPDALHSVYQPIFDLRTGRIRGFECLTRFQTGEGWSPDKWFAEAATAGVGIDLELAAIRGALKIASQLPPEISLSLNASPGLVNSGRLLDELQGIAARRVIIELTEHDAVHDYDELVLSLDALREAGIRIAIDDAGAGHAGLRHIVDLSPDYIKLDISITRDIDKDPARRALAAALAGFCRERGAKLIAEGVETEDELRTLRRLRVAKAQGYLLGRPVPFAEALQLAAAGRMDDAFQRRQHG